MATVTTEFKRLLLRGLAWDAADDEATLEDTLKAACRARLSETDSGLVLVSASGNGTQAEYALPQSASSLTPEAVASAVESLLSIFEECNADLVTAGEETPDDEAILEEMLDRLKPVRSAYADRSGMCLR